MDLADRFAAALGPEDAQVASDVRDYAAWRAGPDEAAFLPDPREDINLRTYLMQLRAGGAGRELLARRRDSLKRFFGWAHDMGLVPSNPVQDFNFERPFLTREQIRRREESVAPSAEEREIERLRALNRIAGQLNSAADVQTAIDSALDTLLEVMDLETAWAFLFGPGGIRLSRPGEIPPHDFTLVSARGLPPGLEQSERYYLTQPPDCHCQSFFRNEKFLRAVNIVECSRLQEASKADGDNRGLLFHASVPLVTQGRLLGVINVATTEWQFLTAQDLSFLTAVGNQVAVALERAKLYQTVEAQRDRYERELQVARQVQASLLPRELPEIPGIRLAAAWKAAREVAGDFYDIFPLHDGRWAWIVADVSDKGAPAALYMAMTRSLVRTTALHHHTPAATLLAVNGLVNAQSSFNMFVTAFLAIYDPVTRTLTYANAGHNPPFLRRAGGEMQLLARTGHFVGVFEHMKLADAAVTLAPGDALVAYTDGVTDALNPAGEDYGEKRLREAVCSGPKNAPELLAHLQADLAAFMSDAAQFDDITFFVLTARE